MSRPIPFLLSGAFAGAVLALGACERTTGPGGGGAVESGSRKVSFVEDVKPFLEAKCLGCHNTTTLLGEFNLESRELAFRSSSGKVFITPGEPENSPVYLALTVPRDDAAAMPPEGHRLDPADVSLIGDWITQGAEWPDGPDGVLRPIDPSAGDPR